MNVIRIVLLAVVMLAGSASRAQNPPQPEPQPQPAAADQQRVKKEVVEAVDAIRDYSVARRQEALARAQQAIARLDQEMADLQARMDLRWKDMSEESRQSSRTEMGDLQRRRSQLAEWFGGMRHSSAEAWGDVKRGFLKSYHELETAVRSASDEYQRKQEESRKEPQPSPEPGKEQQP